MNCRYKGYQLDTNCHVIKVNTGKSVYIYVFEKKNLFSSLIWKYKFLLIIFLL